MKSDTMLTLGVLAIAGYAAYKVIPNLTSPLSYLNTISEEKSKMRKATEKARTPTEVKVAITTSETRLQQAESKQEQKKLRHEREEKVEEGATADVESRETAHEEAVEVLQPERKLRYEEYGTGAKEWFGKMFQPTTPVIEERRKALRKVVSAPINYIKNKVGNITARIKSHTAPPKPESKISSFSTAAPAVKPAISSTIQKITSSASNIPAAMSSLRAAVKSRALPITSWIMKI